MAYYLNPSLYMDPGDADEPSGRCPGTKDHGCGRFAGRAWYCPRCDAEERAAWRAMMAEESAHADALAAAEQAAWEAEERDARALGKIAAWDAELYA
jgi:hypothetical protein